MPNRKNMIAISLGVLLSLLSFSSAQGMSAEEINEAIINGDETSFENMGTKRNSEVITNEDEMSFNYGFKAGTLGLGVHLSNPINDWVSLRLNVNSIKYKSDDNLRYNRLIKTKKTYDLLSAGVLVDFHLWQLRLTTGIYLNNNSIIDTAKMTDVNGVNFNGVNYTSSSVTQVEQTITFNKISPYIGVGWGDNSRREGWSFAFDIGLMYQGDPQLALDITMNQEITLSKADEIKTNANQAIKVQEKDLADLPFYPVVMVGASYSF